MRQLIRILLTFLILGIFSNQTFADIKGGVEYQIPIDYTKLNQEELENKASFYYNLALKTQTHNEEMINALNLYSMLSNKCPDNMLYPERMGVLYDILNKDKLAKASFYKAMGINDNKPETYFYLAEFYYKRGFFKKALRFYKDAYTKGYSKHYETVYKIGDIYEKFGDTEASLKYLKEACLLNPNPDLNTQIMRVENQNDFNKEYYSDTRIRLIER